MLSVHLSMLGSKSLVKPLVYRGIKTTILIDIHISKKVCLRGGVFGVDELINGIPFGHMLLQIGLHIAFIKDIDFGIGRKFLEFLVFG